MSYAILREKRCTLCSTSFKMVCGEMLHPADVLCDACVNALWERAATGDPLELTAELEPRLEGRELGFPQHTVAVQLAQRAYRLRRMIPDKAELDGMLENRTRI